LAVSPHFRLPEPLAGAWWLVQAAAAHFLRACIAKAKDGEGPDTGPSRACHKQRAGAAAIHMCNCNRSGLHAARVARAAQAAVEPVKGPNMRRLIGIFHAAGLPCSPHVKAESAFTRLVVLANLFLQPQYPLSSGPARPMTCVGVRVVGHRRASWAQPKAGAASFLPHRTLLASPPPLLPRLL
jgi:hypothetical protein